jgi:hypothetical protein
MSFPNSHRPLGREIPQHDPAIRISREQAQVFPEKVHAVDLCGVASEYVIGLSWREDRAMQEILGLGGHAFSYL